LDQLKELILLATVAGGELSFTSTSGMLMRVGLKISMTRSTIMGMLILFIIFHGIGGATKANLIRNVKY